MVYIILLFNWVMSVVVEEVKEKCVGSHIHVVSLITYSHSSASRRTPAALLGLTY